MANEFPFAIYVFFIFFLQDRKKMCINLILISYLLKRQIRTKISLLKDILQNLIASVFWKFLRSGIIGFFFT